MQIKKAWSFSIYKKIFCVLCTQDSSFPINYVYNMKTSQQLDDMPQAVPLRVNLRNAQDWIC